MYSVLKIYCSQKPCEIKWLDFTTCTLILKIKCPSNSFVVSNFYIQQYSRNCLKIQGIFFTIHGTVIMIINFVTYRTRFAALAVKKSDLDVHVISNSFE